MAQQVIADEKRYILQTYARPDVVFVSGKGTKLYDTEGKEYLDFAAGIAVNALGERKSKSPIQSHRPVISFPFFLVG